MSKYRRTKDGKFAGSVGEGARQVPTPAPHATPAATAIAGEQDVTQAYHAWKSNTYPQRLTRFRLAEHAWRARTEEAERLKEIAGGRACGAGNCGSCGHGRHKEGACVHVLEGSNDTWKHCGCAQDTEATPEQQRAHDAFLAVRQAYLEMDSAQRDIEKYEPGDAVTVAKGRNVPVGTAGEVLRTHDGDYGLRLLIRTPDGNDVWVAASNTERLTD